MLKKLDTSKSESIKSESFRSIAIFGSTFNPPHRGHEDVIRQATEIADLVIVAPSFSHAFGKTMAPFEQRVQMAKLLVDEMDLAKKVEVTDIERDLFSGRPVYTFDLLEALEYFFPTASLTFVMGPDNADESTWKKFHRAQEIVDRWGIWVAKENINIRSSAIRENIQLGNSVHKNECPPKVMRIAKTLY